MFDFFNGLFQKEVQSVVADHPIVTRALKETGKQDYWYDLKTSDIPEAVAMLQALTDKEKADLALHLVLFSQEHRTASRAASLGDVDGKAYICELLVAQAVRANSRFDDADIAAIANAFADHHRYFYNGLLGWPLRSLIAMVKKKYPKGNITPQITGAFDNIKYHLKAASKDHFEKERLKVIEQIDNVLFGAQPDAAVKPVYFLGEDQFATYANPMIKGFAEEERPHWFRLLAHCQNASGSKPSKKFLTDGSALIQQLGRDRFVEVISDWFHFIARMREQMIPGRYINTYLFLASVNTECVRGFVWLSTTVLDKPLIDAVAAMAGRAYNKIPGVGHTCAALGNATLYALATDKGFDGVNHLSRLNLKVKQAATQKMIETYLNAIAQEKGIGTDMIEDLAVDGFDLADGCKLLPFIDYTAQIVLEHNGKVTLSWLKKDGSVQKSDPAAVKEQQAKELKELKADIKAIETAYATQRERLDRSFRAERQMSWEHFNNCFHQHGLLSQISRRMIWRFEKDDLHTDAVFVNGAWQDGDGAAFVPGDTFMISLWHPATDTVANVKRWRDHFTNAQIQQPVKQAYREVYLLTDAEVRTNTYSNRMAGHILKQHQFNSLTKARGWRYDLQGGFDGGSDGTARLTLPQQKLVAEFWTNGIDDLNEMGIMNYVSTDQVRFRKTNNWDAIPIQDIPVVALSEVMRDVDLFVGVASVGNDPNWRDNGGLRAYHDYWQQYAFGDLSENAKSRREILERLVPALKFGKVSTLTDKFLIVKGKMRTYKIHLGSTNILMEPNDQYLCIVPDRSMKSLTTNVFLPFEGDAGLSIIISKATLLADDDKITDESITRQIKRN
ncbi:DUF4132 domain-containing protein [Mucilaginibacter myungsuensis]|uniref:DUF4132 domain-containing protein n=1 Tax=Mucilaginibacter myungsuensis TaxID=649104 RepID=A0A929KZ42_9SPHI|nr:DUF4132 domain-containing protein [Mucilaginibacter myungsuensis]MBE9661529.1 DUF4132 domain-containing protein [Mucilaginibacter myungsuensis]